MSIRAELGPPLPAGLPADWLLDVDLPCPTCRYNLRRLHVPRCPECGGAFRWQTLLHVSCPRCAGSLETEDGASCPRCELELDWARLLGERDPAEFTQFEYTLRPVRAGLVTMLAVLLPGRFWRTIRVEWPPAVTRLRRLRLLFGFFFVLGVISLYAVAAFTIGMRWWFPDILEQAVGWVAPAISLIVTAAVMPMFTPTLSRFRIRRDQLLRVFAYGAAGLSWLGLFYLLVAATAIAVPVLTPLFPAALAAGLPTPFFPDVLSGVELLTIRWTPMGYSRLWGVSMPHHLLNVAMPLSILLLGFVWWWRFLFVALRSYLRLNRFDAWALLISTQVIVVLTTMIFVVAAGGHAWTMYLGRLLLH